MLYTTQGVYRTDFIDERSLDLTEWSLLKETDIKTLLLAGTPFQQKVWQAALNIPAGKVISYQGLAQMINNPVACRAVGTALGTNPSSIWCPAIVLFVRMVGLVALVEV